MEETSSNSEYESEYESEDTSVYMSSEIANNQESVNINVVNEYPISHNRDPPNRIVLEFDNFSNRNNLYQVSPFIDNIEHLADMINSYQSNSNIPYLPVDNIDQIMENDEIINIENAECHVCLCDKNDKQVLDKSINNLTEVPDNCIFASPCKKHFICKECFIKIALDFDNHPINHNHSLIRCLYSGEDCINENGFFTYFNNIQVKRILNKDQYMLYKNYSDNYMFPGFKVEKCPYINCSCDNLISIEDINNVPIGNLIIECSQSFYCDYRYCYNCKRPLLEYQSCCGICINLEDSNNPHSYNYFLIKKTENKMIKNQSDYLYKQKEITLEIAVNHIKEILYSSDSKFSIQCPKCLNHFYKSEKCAGLKHCNIERCYSCGRIQNELEYELNDHWSEMGVRGCPRFDDAYYWNNIANCDFKCSENTYENGCYNHEIGECTNYKHENGITNMVDERKQAFIYNFLKSLLKDLRNSVMDEMKDILNTEFIKKVFIFIDKNKQYSGDYTPIVFLDKMNE